MTRRGDMWPGIERLTNEGGGTRLMKVNKDVN
jgi:hypothetical protein